MMRCDSLRSSAMVLTLAAVAALSGVVGLTVTGGTFSSPTTATQSRAAFCAAWNNYMVTQVPRSLSGATNTTTYHDSVYVSTAGTNVTDVAIAVASDPTCPTNYPVTYAVSNIYAPTNGVFAFLGTNNYLITAMTANQTNVFTGTTPMRSSGTTYAWSTNAAGSLAQAQNALIDGQMAATAPSVTVEHRYSSWTTSTATMTSNTFVPNASIWTPLNLTCVSAFNSSGGPKFQFTAISPRHCIGAAHVTPAVGTQFNFVGASGTVYTRSVVGTANPVDDVCVVALNADLPSDVTPAQLLPSNYASYLSLGYASGTYPMRLRVWFVDQEMQVSCCESSSISSSAYGVPYLFYQTPSTSTGAAFSSGNNLWSGDSSCPELVSVGGHTVVLSCWHYGNGAGNASGYFAGGSAPSLADQLAPITSAMSALSTRYGFTSGETSAGAAYAPTTASLSGYSTF